MSRRRTRRPVVAPLAAAVLATAALGVVGVVPSASATTTGSTLARYERAAARYASAHGMTAGVAVLDTTTGAVTTAGAATKDFTSASVVKALIATRLLIAGKMTGIVAKEAHLMIAESDNTAADELYPKAGSETLLPFLARHYGIKNLGAPATAPGLWGTTQLTASGLVRLYAAVRHDPKVWPWLSKAMHDHTAKSSAGEPNNFGVAAAEPGAAVKNGWVVSGGHAFINTTGFVDHNRYAVAILSEGPTSLYYAPGEKLITHEAELVVRRGGLLAKGSPARRYRAAQATSVAEEWTAGRAAAVTGASDGKPIIVLDPGHNGGNETHIAEINKQVYAGYGRYKACNTTGTETNAGYPEHKFTFDVAKRVRAILLQDGFAVVMTRANDHGVGPCVSKRAAIESGPGVVAAVAIHADGAPASGHGFHVNEDKKRPEGASKATVTMSYALGRAVHKELEATSGLVPSTYIGHNGFYYRTDLAGLNLSTKPTTFLELGNMRNAHDARLQSTTKGRERIAKAVAAGILLYADKYVTQPSPPTGPFPPLS